MFENRAKGQTSEAIRKLMGLQARTTRIVRNGEEMEVPIAQVQLGDVILVRPGEKIPTDGEVISGSSTVAASDITLISGDLQDLRKQQRQTRSFAGSNNRW